MGRSPGEHRHIFLLHHFLFAQNLPGKYFPRVTHRTITDTRHKPRWQKAEHSQGKSADLKGKIHFALRMCRMLVRSSFSALGVDAVRQRIYFLAGFPAGSIELHSRVIFVLLSAHHTTSRRVQTSATDRLRFLPASAAGRRSGATLGSMLS